MAADPLTGFDFDEAAGTMDTKEQKSRDDHLLVQFFLHPVVDFLLTEGGELPKTHPRVKEFREREKQRLEALRALHPFDEVAPDKVPDNAPEAAKRMYADAYAEWEERRRNHDEELRLEAAILLDHPENSKVYVVQPAGRPVYIETEFIRIIKPGDRDSVLEVPVNAEYKKRFYARYAQWKEGVAGEGAVGLPLREVPFINTAQREEFAYFGIRTAEQLVGLSDAVAQHFMGVRQLQQRVKAWLEATTGGDASIRKLQAEMKAKDDEMGTMREAIAQLQKQLAERGAVPVSDVGATVERLQREATREPAPRSRRV